MTDADKETRPRYPGICPKCGAKFWATKSMGMEFFGMNDFGGGQCKSCNTHMHLTFRPETQDFDAEPYGDYLRRPETQQKERIAQN